jgi:hypothetical protein
MMDCQLDAGWRSGIVEAIRCVTSGSLDLMGDDHHSALEIHRAES